MYMLIVAISKLLALVANNIAASVQTPDGEKIVTQILATLPGDLGVMIVQFITGLHGLKSAVQGMMT
jgi:hypothetical protein